MMGRKKERIIGLLSRRKEAVDAKVSFYWPFYWDMAGQYATRQLRPHHHREQPSRFTMLVFLTSFLKFHIRFYYIIYIFKLAQTRALTKSIRLSLSLFSHLISVLPLQVKSCCRIAIGIGRFLNLLRFPSYSCVEVILVGGTLVPVFHASLLHVNCGQNNLVLQLLSMGRKDAENVLIKCWRGVGLQCRNKFLGVMVSQLEAYGLELHC